MIDRPFLHDLGSVSPLRGVQNQSSICQIKRSSTQRPPCCHLQVNLGLNRYLHGQSTFLALIKLTGQTRMQRQANCGFVRSSGFPSIIAYRNWLKYQDSSSLMQFRYQPIVHKSTYNIVPGIFFWYKIQPLGFCIHDWLPYPFHLFRYSYCDSTGDQFQVFLRRYFAALGVANAI